MDLFDEFMDYSAGMPSPEVFRRWGAIALIAGALERRCYVYSNWKPIYPNLYTLFVAPPAVGKYIIEEVRGILRDAKKFHVAPNSTTKASLIDSIAGALTVIPTKDEGLIEYHSLFVAAEEFGVLLPEYNLEFLSVLNSIYNNPDAHSERRRSVNAGEEMIITNPQLNIIAGTQPGFMAELFPESAWSTGTASRLIMVYDAAPVRVELFPPQSVADNRRKRRSNIVTRIGALRDLRGEFGWEIDARDVMANWYMTGMQPAPKHSKLLYYNGRRILHVLKLCVISAVARDPVAKTITAFDLDRAQNWLLSAEAIMPDVFRSMTQRSDYEVMLELHRFVWREHARIKAPVQDSMLIDYMSQRVPNASVLRIIELAEKSNMIERMAGNALGSGAKYIPKAKNDTGVE